MVAGYESDALLHQYMDFHYGDDPGYMPYTPAPDFALRFPSRCARHVLDHASRHGRALDLGCAVGRSGFELSSGFDEVVGIDYSHNFIRACETLRREGEMPYARVLEGETHEVRMATVPEGSRADRCRFQQGDACALDGDLGAFDAALLANLLCRLPDPIACLSRLPSLIRPGGVVVITTPCSWMEDHTPKHLWLGGYERDGEPVDTLDGLSDQLSEHFDRVLVVDEPFLIREHRRKYQFTYAQLSVWRRLA